MGADASRHAIIGTAGHIDHGKTSLVRRLTGIDTDRLPEERARGISIDLGFAHFTAGEFEFGVVDVPGHERFVRNMVAGATGVDIALLLVAADDGVMPQTLEHLEIMDLLGIPAGVVALSKIDLVEPEFVELVRAEVVDRTRGTFLEGCPIVPFSSQTGAGLDELREAVVQTARRSHLLRRSALFRMPIDRVFSVAGHGTVATGTVLGGEVRPGDPLELQPAGIPLRVRSVQNHGLAADSSGTRQRTAVNLAGVKVEELHRGMEIAHPGYLHPAQRLLVKVRCLPRSSLELRDRMELNLHLGTREVAARVILKGRRIAPGESGYAELRVREPVVAAYGQRYILRRPSPEMTVAGGAVLDPGLAPRERIESLESRGSALDSPDANARLSAWLATVDRVSASPLMAAWKTGVEPAELPGRLDELIRSGTLIPATHAPYEKGAVANAVTPSEISAMLASRHWLHRERAAALSARLMQRIRDELARQQPRRSLPRKVFTAACQRLADPHLIEALIDRLLHAGELVRVGGNIGPADAQVKLSKSQAALREALLAAIQTAKLSPPTLKELAAALGKRPEDVTAIATVCTEDGQLVDIGEGFCFAPEALDQARNQCRAVFAEQGGAATLSQLREAWQTSRKYAVPLAEFFDARRVTLRDGDLRRAGPQFDAPLL